MTRRDRSSAVDEQAFDPEGFEPREWEGSRQVSLARPNVERVEPRLLSQAGQPNRGGRPKPRTLNGGGAARWHPLFGGGLGYAKLLGSRGLPIIDACASAHDLTGAGLAPSTGSGGGLGAARASATRRSHAASMRSWMRARACALGSPGGMGSRISITMVPG
jgi:hypothetical protein